MISYEQVLHFLPMGHSLFVHAQKLRRSGLLWLYDAEFISNLGEALEAGFPVWLNSIPNYPPWPGVSLAQAADYEALVQLRQRLERLLTQQSIHYMRCLPSRE